MAAELQRAFPDRIHDIKMIKGHGGVFEVRNGEQLIFSKKQVGRFPEPSEVVDLLSGSGA